MAEATDLQVPGATAAVLQPEVPAATAVNLHLEALQAAILPAVHPEVPAAIPAEDLRAAEAAAAEAIAAEVDPEAAEAAEEEGNFMFFA